MQKKYYLTSFVSGHFAFQVNNAANQYKSMVITSVEKQTDTGAFTIYPIQDIERWVTKSQHPHQALCCLPENPKFH